MIFPPKSQPQQQETIQVARRRGLDKTIRTQPRTDQRGNGSKIKRAGRMYQ